MLQTWVAACLGTLLLVGPATAADEGKKVEAAKKKAHISSTKIY